MERAYNLVTLDTAAVAQVCPEMGTVRIEDVELSRSTSKSYELLCEPSQRYCLA
jgi:predicted RNA-binding Zn-ribbon protein involved in translation (DUF1610 family)